MGADCQTGKGYAFRMGLPQPGLRSPSEDEAERVALVDAAADILAATGPYVEDAATGETLFGPWAHRFDHLTRARANLVAALAALADGAENG